MATDEERAFATTLLNTLGTQPVIYPDDYQQPPQNFLKKIPVVPVRPHCTLRIALDSSFSGVQISLPDPPRKNDAPAPAGELFRIAQHDLDHDNNPCSNRTASDTISVTFKCLKPLKTFTLSVQPTDAISEIKNQLASQSGAPPADSQRLLLKGKALVSSKLLKEYDVKDGDTINLMVKPGFAWDPAGGPPPLLVETAPTPQPTLGTSSRRHQRIPSVVLTPSPSPTTEKPVDIPLTLDTVSDDRMSGIELSSYHNVLARPTFWSKFLHFVKYASLCSMFHHASLTSVLDRSEFENEEDVNQAFEDFFCVSKGTLTAFEIAKIRDELGIIGMAGI
jgi:hypothetical protein